MATFTMTVAEIMNHDPESDPKRLGLDDYPIFRDDYRPTLNQKIIRRFWTREIGFESDSLFAWHMRAKMHEIMPLYNQLHLSTELEFDPFETVNMQGESTETGTGHAETTGNALTNSNSEAESSNTGDSTNRVVSSDTPQVQLSGNGDYATSATDSVGRTVTDNTSNAADTQTSESGTESDQTTTGESINKTAGTQGVKSVLLMQYRESMLNIDVDILSDLDPLFMQIWGNGDTYTTTDSQPFPMFGIHWPFY